MPVYKKVNKDFFKKWKHEMAYVLGFFAADGYITVNKRGGQFWCIKITDKKLLEEIRNKIDSNHKIGIRIGLGKEKIQYRLQIGSIEMCDDLRKLGFSERKTKSLAVPYVPKKYFSDFVRGYFDGDGNVWSGFVHKKQKIPNLKLMVMFTSCSFDFLEQLQEKMLNFGIGKGSIYRSKRNYSRLQFSTRDALKIYDFMYNNKVKDFDGLYLKRKKQIFEKFMRLRL
ncbi:MAG: LAGLIDADG family homing endonuclease [Candidatus Paceibacterota bacterium]